MIFDGLSHRGGEEPQQIGPLQRADLLWFLSSVLIHPLHASYLSDGG